MPSITLLLNGDGCWPDLGATEEEIDANIASGRLTWLGNGSKPIQVALLDKGMQSGNPSVSIRFDLPDGKTVVAETSLKLFYTAARAMLARYPHLLD